MKTTIEKMKYTQTITTTTTIRKICQLAYINSGALIEQTNKLFRNTERAYKKRITCNCCDKGWTDNEPVFMAFTDKGNKLICGECKRKLEG